MKEKTNDPAKKQQAENGNPSAMDNEYLTAEEVASILRVQPLAIYRWLESGKLRGIKISPKIWRIRRAEVDDFLNRHESQWCYDYGMKLVSIGGPENIRKGIAELERAINLYPENKEAHLSLSNIYLDQAKYDRTQLDKANERLKSLIKFSPEEVEVHSILEQINRITGFGGEEIDREEYSDKLKDAFTKQINRLAHFPGQVFGEMYNTAKSLCKIVAERDGYKHEDLERKARHAQAMAQELGFERVKTEFIQLATLLYDIGKIYISKNILLKPDKLTKEELELIREHPQHGERILKQIGLPQEVLSAVRCHHESLDGSGYPQGLSGQGIPAEAHIIKIIDSYGAMVSERPYRKPLTHQQAVDELKNSAGKHLEPRIVNTFLSVLKKEQKAGLIA